MSYKIEVLPKASRQMGKLPRDILPEIIAAIDSLADNPHPKNSRKLSGKSNIWRLRIRNYRIAYRIEKKEILVLIIAIGHRKDIYKKEL
jgi:mRNA interferase RelE/StbE